MKAIKKFKFRSIMASDNMSETLSFTSLLIIDEDDVAHKIDFKSNEIDVNTIHIVEVNLNKLLKA